MKVSSLPGLNLTMRTHSRGPMIPGDDFEPPLQETFTSLLENSQNNTKRKIDPAEGIAVVEEQSYSEVPLIDISWLQGNETGRKKCTEEIVRAAKEWGFFQIVNHGIPGEVLEDLKREQEKLFRQPFLKKVEREYLNLRGNSYRWGNPQATCLRQLSWLEAFHIPVAEVSRIELQTLRFAIESFAMVATSLAEKIAGILAENLGVKDNYFRENCSNNSCYLRMNRYPPCPFFTEVFGLMPHTDSDFITVLFQFKNVQGLQLMKDDGSWVNISPNPDAIVINIGDLFQAWSNGVYKSVKHRVKASVAEERLSVAFFYCPESETVIQSCINPAVYRNFSFHEYRAQVQRDVEATGDKVGLSRFLL